MSKIIVRVIIRETLPEKPKRIKKTCEVCRGEKILHSPYGGVWRPCFRCKGKGYERV